MTDRAAAVMKCFGKKLKDLTSGLRREIQLHFLNRYAHFLLNLRWSCELSLQLMQEEIV